MVEASTFGARLRGLRLARGLSQVSLARHVGRHQTAIGPYERNEYVPPRGIIVKLAGALGTTPEFLMFGGHVRSVALTNAGTVRPGGMVAASNGTASYQFHADQLVTFDLDDDSMAPVFRAGQLLLCAARTAEAESLLGRDAIVTLRDGRQILRRLAPGSRADLFTLHALNAPSLADVEVREARRVVGAIDADTVTSSRISQPQSS